MTTDIRTRLAVRPEQLRRVVAPVPVPVGVDVNAVIGQEEALETVRMGLQLDDTAYNRQHYNVAVVGSPSTGRMAKTLRFVSDYAAAQADRPPPDAICLHNFENPHRPLMFVVPNGHGALVNKEMEGFVELINDTLPEAVATLRAVWNDLRTKHIRKVIDAAKKKMAASCVVIKNKNGHLAVALVSLTDPTKAMSVEDFEALDEEIRERLSAELSEASELLKKAHEELVNHLEKQDMKHAQQLADFISSKCQEIVDKVSILVGEDERLAMYLSTAIDMAGRVAALEEAPSDETKERVKLLLSVNVVVDNAGVLTPPVIHCAVPRFPALFGKVTGEPVAEDKVRFDHTMVEAGDVLRANGGYLILDAADLLRWGHIHSLYKLFEVLSTGELSIQGLMSFLGAERMTEFLPEPVPVGVKVIVICDRWLDHVLRHHLPEFDSLFRITAEFDSRMSAEDAGPAYALFVAQCREKDGLPEFTPEAVAALIEEGHRRADDQLYVSAQFGIVKDLVTEAAYWARQEDAEKVGRGHVKRAIAERFRRRTLSIRRYQGFVDRGHILLDLEGERVGQINALAVMGGHSEHAFGLPMRVTVRTYKGKKGVVLVQREIGTSGPSSNQAIAIIGGWLAGQYGQKQELTLGAQVCFEQNYGGIDGDSATVAETVAIISALTGLPVDQRLTVTGSMSQMGDVQPIGGANQKIEGHYDLLKRKGLLGPGKGVALPVTNLENLMLPEEIVAASEAGTYVIHAIKTIDEALELFLGRPIAEIRELAEAALTGRKPKLPKPAIKWWPPPFPLHRVWIG